MKITRANEIKLIFSFVIALIIFISLVSFDPNDVTFLTSSPNYTKNNVVGSVGAYMAWILLFLAGYGAYIIPIFIAFWGTAFILEDKPRKFYLRLFGALFSVFAISSMLSLMGAQESVYRFERGGIIGLAFSDFLIRYLGSAGTVITIVLLFMLSFVITTDFLIVTFIVWAFKALKTLIKNILTSVLEKARSKPRIINVQRRAAPVAPAASPKLRPAQQVKKQAPEPGTAPVKTSARQAKKEPEKINIEDKPFVQPEPYELPSIELLNSSPEGEESEIKEDFEAKSKILEETLADFGINAKVVEVNQGPVITRYELEPASGVKVHKITSLSDNIALSMKSISVRIVAPIPGKGTIGVEVPNQKNTIVYLRELLESKEYRSSKAKLRLVLGKDISGEPIFTNLADMPHLLIAGATGSGKTVCVNSIITTLLFNASPEELKLLMIDPKRVELAPFNNLPHLVAPVVTDSKKASQALGWLVNEMDSRYETFSRLAVRNIDGYNKKAKEENLQPLPYIVVLIDELHDLMLVAQQEVESMITRIAQLSRAVGIHMIIATQRPSVDVITGVIKANLPSRISFKVASKVDSRTVLDMNGADKLLGKGDMLFLEPGNPKPIRAQGSLVGDDEINRVTDFIKAQRTAKFEDSIIKESEKQSFKTFEKDEVYDEAVKLVLQSKQASVSMLQRRLGVGYTRAARLIDMMEDERIVGPYQGSKPREILADKNEE